jgi:hypothetical protein
MAIVCSLLYLFDVPWQVAVLVIAVYSAYFHWSDFAHFVWKARC